MRAFGVAVTDENPAFRRKRNIGCSAECIDRHLRPPTDVNLKQFLALRTELEDCRISRVGRPTFPSGSSRMACGILNRPLANECRTRPYLSNATTGSALSPR